jgi:hypothetical protein
LWKAPASTMQTTLQQIHDFSLATLHATYPLLVKQDENSVAFEGSEIQRVSSNISCTLPESTLDKTNMKDILGYNEDLAAYVKYIKGGSKLYDGVQNLRNDVVVATAPERKNGLPWFGRVLQIFEETEQVLVHWMDRCQSNAMYFYLTDNTSTVHYDSIICNGVEFEPVLQDTLQWKLVTPLAFIQSMNTDVPPTLLQNDDKIKVYEKSTKFDLTQMVFGSSQEFMEFIKYLQ